MTYHKLLQPELKSFIASPRSDLQELKVLAVHRDRKTVEQSFRELTHGSPPLRRNKLTH